MEKVNNNTDHSMVWSRIEESLFQYKGDMMEALFGYVVTNQKTSNDESTTSEAQNSNTAPKIILDSRWCQNITIVIRSLAISHEELIDGLPEGKGLSVKTPENNSAHRDMLLTSLKLDLDNHNGPKPLLNYTNIQRDVIWEMTVSNWTLAFV